jgi:hypothetical protein
MTLTPKPKDQTNIVTRCAQAARPCASQQPPVQQQRDLLLLTFAGLWCPVSAIFQTKIARYRRLFVRTGETFVRRRKQESSNGVQQ